MSKLYDSLGSLGDFQTVAIQNLYQGKAKCAACLCFAPLKPHERDEWKKLDGEGSVLDGLGKAGFCKRHAPQPRQGGNLFQAVWPLTGPDSGCGDFLSREYAKECEERRQLINNPPWARPR